MVPNSVDFKFFFLIYLFFGPVNFSVCAWGCSAFLIWLKYFEKFFGGAPVHNLQGLHKVEEGISGVPTLAIASQGAGDVSALKTISFDICWNPTRHVGTHEQYNILFQGFSLLCPMFNSNSSLLLK